MGLANATLENNRKNELSMDEFDYVLLSYGDNSYKFV